MTYDFMANVFNDGKVLLYYNKVIYIMNFFIPIL